MLINVQSLKRPEDGSRTFLQKWEPTYKTIRYHNSEDNNLNTCTVMKDAAVIPNHWNTTTRLYGVKRPHPEHSYSEDRRSNEGQTAARLYDVTTQMIKILSAP